MLYSRQTFRRIKPELRQRFPVPHPEERFREPAEESLGPRRAVEGVSGGEIFFKNPEAEGGCFAYLGYKEGVFAKNWLLYLVYF